MSDERERAFGVRAVNMLVAAQLNRRDLVQQYLDEMSIIELESIGNAADTLSEICRDTVVTRIAYAQGEHT